MTGEFSAVANIRDFADSPLKVVEVEGREILIAKAGDEYLAAGNRCPHMSGHLSYGTLEGSVIKCYAHGRRFDLRNGNPQTSGLGKLLGGHGLTTYEVKLQGEEILVSTTPRPAGTA
jgi:3-phenylpropionate/trans-cinnamate dioxygenase ferredoxin component